MVQCSRVPQSILVFFRHLACRHRDLVNISYCGARECFELKTQMLIMRMTSTIRKLCQSNRKKCACVIKCFYWLNILKLLLNITFYLPMVKISFRVNLLFDLFFHRRPIQQLFLSCRPFVVNTFSTGLVGVEVSSVSWLGQLTVGV